MSYELQIALRVLRSKQRSGFISFITYISIAGVAIGVAALIIIVAVMNGYETEVQNRLISIDAHVRVRTFHDRGIENYQNSMKEVSSIPHIKAITPYIFGKGLILSSKTSTEVLIRGIEPETANSVIDISQAIIDGGFNFNNEEKLKGVLVGHVLAGKLAVTVGDTIKIASLTGVSEVGPTIPNLMAFQVTGIVKTGLYEFDNTYVFLSVSSSQRLFNMPNKVTGLELKLDNVSFSEQVAQAVRDKMGYPYHALTWYDMNAPLFSWYKMQKMAGIIILGLIIMVAAFNIISTLIMVTMEKKKEIGILKALGAPSKSIWRIFAIEGFIIGTVGTILGAAIGLLLCWVQYHFQVISLPQDVYIIGWLPIDVDMVGLVQVCVVAILLTFIAALYPAVLAAKLNPVDAIRYE